MYLCKHFGIMMALLFDVSGCIVRYITKAEGKPPAFLRNLGIFIAPLFEFSGCTVQLYQGNTRNPMCISVNTAQRLLRLSLMFSVVLLMLFDLL